MFFIKNKQLYKSTKLLGGYYLKRFKYIIFRLLGLTLLGFVLGFFWIYYTTKNKEMDNISYEYIDPIPTVPKYTRQRIDSEPSAAAEQLETVVGIQDDWVLVWEDQFTHSFLDETKWTAEDWAANKNEELQYYSPNNVKTVNGKLVLISKKETYQGRDYTSGAIHTKDKLEVQYGKLEMRAKLPVGQGIFPAFWLLTSKESTWLPEIDIVEMLGHKPTEIWMVLHWLDQNNKLTSVSTSFEGNDFSRDFHTYELVWNEQYIAWFIDGVERYRTSAHIPTDPMYLYINTAIGGVWPGSPDHTTIFPTFFEVDYVRVYKKNGV